MEITGGSGKVTKKLLDYCGNINVISVDESRAMIDTLKSKFPDSGKVKCV
ncbi:MAG: class I SAM-dependent methyltransferase [Treponema sp.]|nr:class I SAM-dependent methyltransferase [Treponema sp.]